MGRISAGDAIIAGFRLIAREPAAVAVWCGIYALLGLTPQIFMLRSQLQLWQTMLAPGGGSTTALMAAQGEMYRYLPLSYLATFVILLLIPPAACRAVLRPQDRSWFYLRLGARELWMILSIVVITVMLFIGYLCALIPVAILSAIGAALAGGRGGGAVVLLALLIIPAFGLLLWGLLRFSLAPVMSFAERSFRLPEAWRLSKGHGGKLFLIWAALIGLTILVEVVMLAPVVLVALQGKLGVAGADPMAAIRRLGVPGLVAAGAIFAVLGTWIYVMWSASWAQIYKDLKVAPADVFD